MSQDLPFEPYPFIDDPHKQTILSAMFNLVSEPPSTEKRVRLPDGDQLSLMVTTPSSWTPEKLTVFLVHGVCGSHRSPYLIRMAKCLEAIGMRAVRLNMRNAGSGRGLAKRLYHGGGSEDIFECIKLFKKEHPEAPIVLIGFSLGGNVVLKISGELGTLAPHFLKKVIAVSPPVELYSSIQMLGDADNEIYEKYFYRFLRQEVLYIHDQFKELPSPKLPKSLKVYEFDQYYTARRCGFKSAIDYYNKCSSSHLISDIAIPCKILFSKDDPIVSADSLDAYNLPAHIQIYKTEKGGHMGYLGTSEGNSGLYWLDQVLLDWIQEE